MIDIQATGRAMLKPLTERGQFLISIAKPQIERWQLMSLTIVAVVETPPYLNQMTKREAKNGMRIQIMILPLDANGQRKGSTFASQSN
jgi:hypothetical protein